MEIDQTKTRRHGRALLTGGALMAAIAVLLLAVASLSGALGGSLDELIAHTAKEIRR